MAVHGQAQASTSEVYTEAVERMLLGEMQCRGWLEWVGDQM